MDLLRFSQGGCVKLAAQLIFFVLRMSGVSWLLRFVLQRRAITILVYHDPSPPTFDEHLRYLKSRFTIISMDNAVAALQNDKVKELGCYPLVITIDDGRARNRQLLPAIQTHGVRPLIYLCSQVVGTRRAYWDDVVMSKARDELLPIKKMTETARRQTLVARFNYRYEDEMGGASSALSLEEIQAMLPFVDFGSHGRFHQPIPFLTDAEMRQELQLSKKEIEELTGRSCRHFAFPTGFHDERSRDAVAAAGYSSARSTDAGYNRRPTDLYWLRVTGASDDASVSKLALQVTGVLRYLKRLVAR